MADLEKTIAIIFQGDDRVGKTITGISSGLDSLASKTVTATQPLADLAESALKAEAALAALTVAGLVGAFKASSDFESATIELKKVIGDEIPLLNEARVNALGLSDQYGQSARDILQSTADFKQAGFDVKDSMELTKTALDLVIAGNVEASQASEILVAILKGFKAPATDAGVALDILNEVSNNFATDVEQLGIGMAELSPIARTMGFSMAETAGILTPVIEIFRSGDEAAVALKTGLLKLVDDSKPVQEALRQIGVSQYDANGQLRSGKDILFDVSTAFQTLDQNQKLYVTQQLVGINQAARMVEVFDGLAKSTEVTAVALNSAGSAAQEVQARLASAEVAVDRFGQGFVNLGIIVGDQFKEAAKGAIDGGTDIENALRDIIDNGTFAPIFNAINAFAENLGRDLKTIAANMPDAFDLIDWEPLLASIRGLGGEIGDLFNAFFGDIDLKTPEGLSEVIQKIINSATALTNVVGGILDAWEPFVKALSEGIDAFYESDEGIQRLVGQFLSWGQVINTVADNIGALTGSLNLIGGALSVMAVSNIPSAIGALKGFATTIGTATLGVGQFVAVLAAPIGGWYLGTWLRDNVPIVKDFGDALGDLAYKIINFGDDGVEAAVKQAQYNKSLGDAAVAMVRAKEAAGELPSQKTTEVAVTGTAAYQLEFDDILKQIQSLPEEKTTDVKAEVNTASVQNVKDYIIEELPDGTVTIVQTKMDSGSLATTKAQIETLPTEKELEIKLQGQIDTEIARIKAEAETVQTAVEWKAKLDIAEVEAASQTIIALSGDLSEMFASTGESIQGLAGQLASLSPGSPGAYAISKILEEETRTRQELAATEIELSKAQIEYMNARTTALAGGQGIITINSNNLEPELQLVLHKILELTQIEANEQGLEYLIGVT